MSHLVRNFLEASDPVTLPVSRPCTTSFGSHGGHGMWIGEAPLDAVSAWGD